jgi:hypothetical protein
VSGLNDCQFCTSSHAASATTPEDPVGYALHAQRIAKDGYLAR